MNLANMSHEERSELSDGYFKVPERIYLLRGEDDVSWKRWPQGALWCADAIYKYDVEYIRADLYKDIKDELEKERLFIALDQAADKMTDSQLEQTRDFDQHPEWYDNACLCQLCCSYGSTSNEL